MAILPNNVSIEISVQGLTLRKEVPDAWSGGNPLFHAKEARQVLDKVVGELDALIASHYGDIRGREFGQETMEVKNIRVPSDLWRKAMGRAASEGTNVSAVLRDALVRYVN